MTREKMERASWWMGRRQKELSDYWEENRKGKVMTGKKKGQGDDWEENRKGKVMTGKKKGQGDDWEEDWKS